VSYMAGEPLLNPHLLDWLRQAAGLGLDLRFTTNGYALDAELAAQLVATNPFNVGVSLESLDPAINEMIRPIPGGTEKTIRAIELLLAERQKQKSRVSINIKCTLTGVNYQSVPDLVRRFGKREGVLITPQPFEVMDGMPEETRRRLWIHDIEGLKRMIAELIRLQKEGYNINAETGNLLDFVKQYEKDSERAATMSKRIVARQDSRPCHIGSYSIFIVDSGDVHLCPHHAPIGNILGDRASLKEMWYGDRARSERQAIRACRLLCNLSCLRETSLWHKIRTFLKM
jgi:MoaA/NifB/PqqE/SkfB family radical SAM enzyme